jgi:hypothetical protein
MRVLHGPVNVGNQPWVLSRAERELGVESDLVVNYNTWLDYSADRVLGGYGERSAASFARRINFGLRAPFRYDVLHFYFGRSYLFFEDRGGSISMLAPLLAADLRLARRLGKKVFMTLQGCDARIASASHERNTWTMCSEGRCSSYGACLGTYDAQRRRMIENLLPHCDRVFYLNPELGYELPGDAVFLPYASCQIDAFKVVLPRATVRPRIVHAPSNSGIKGTPMILAALEALRSRFDFELILVENKPHAEALRIYADADIAIDQILAGWYGGYAVEMMASGKPVACAIRDDDLKFVPEPMRSDLPLLRLRPDRLVDDLAAILSSQAQWPEQGRRARRFVERWHNPLTIARAMIACYRDSASHFDLSAAEATKPCVALTNELSIDLA